eukprot:10596016-Alexandrium_andersonii.AAC.1
MMSYDRPAHDMVSAKMAAVRTICSTCRQGRGGAKLANDIAAWARMLATCSAHATILGDSSSGLAHMFYIVRT